MYNDKECLKIINNKQKINEEIKMLYFDNDYNDDFELLLIPKWIKVLDFRKYSIISKMYNNSSNFDIFSLDFIPTYLDFIPSFIEELLLPLEIHMTSNIFLNLPKKLKYLYCNDIPKNIKKNELPNFLEYLSVNKKLPNIDILPETLEYVFIRETTKLFKVNHIIKEYIEEKIEVREKH